jgi:N-acetylneuraminic acid mutarotase
MKKIALVLGVLLGMSGCQKKDDPPVEDVGTTDATGFYPNAADVGSTVTIIGHGFSATPANNRVNFTRAEATAFFVRKGSAEDTLQVLVPPGAVTGPLTVKVHEQSATTRFPFVVVPGKWTRKADFPGGAGMYGTGFLLAGKTYALKPGTNEMWAYDASQDTWQKKATCPVGNVPLTSRSGEMLSFVVDNFAYVGVYLYDYPVDEIRFFRYDPATDTWTVRAPLGRIDAHHGTVFGLGSKGYLIDTNDYTKSVWEYNPTTNSWTRKGNFPGVGRYASTAFAIGTKGYIGGGDTGTSGSPPTDFWEYDSATDTWTRKADIPATNDEPNGFAINGMGYMVSGANQMFGYNPATDVWTRQANFIGRTFTGKVYINTGSKGYVMRGRGLSNDTYADFWQFSLN